MKIESPYMFNTCVMLVPENIHRVHALIVRINILVIRELANTMAP